MHIQPYLFFNGRCEEALSFYQQKLGAHIEVMMRYKEAPASSPDCTPPGSDEKIMHASLRIGDTTLMASDGNCQGEPPFQGVALSLTAASTEEANRLFNALAEDGQIQLPIGATFFSPCFGMVTDRFGLPWMVIISA